MRYERVADANWNRSRKRREEMTATIRRRQKYRFHLFFSWEALYSFLF